MEPCQSTTSFKKWECKDGDLLSIQGEQLYFNYGNLGNYIVLWPRNRAWSRLVKYSTGRSLCDEGWYKIKFEYLLQEQIGDLNTYRLWLTMIMTSPVLIFTQICSFPCLIFYLVDTSPCMSVRCKQLRTIILTNKKRMPKAKQQKFRMWVPQYIYHCG